MPDLRAERGAVAVEFALLLPVLVVLLVGILEFGVAYGAQISITGAARDGARTMAIESDPARTRNAVRAAAPALDPTITDSQISITTSAGALMNVCKPGETTTITVTYPYTFLTGMFGATVTMSGKAAMRCGG
ncbi:TadE/TadG family type IV pilus assembly protein [Glaciibacter superstes]|uniref:TadE/TadG family type IV pilus assembly protein n=1 Tax=Glaciibacter superstes TaxID=501023 RepID=UPI0003B57F06|nr:TadE family type IV pilus minor pilin [Glaciibacter superstes]